MGKYHVNSRVTLNQESIGKLDAVRQELSESIGIGSVTRPQAVQYIVNKYLKEQKGNQE